MYMYLQYQQIKKAFLWLMLLSAAILRGLIRGNIQEFVQRCSQISPTQELHFCIKELPFPLSLTQQLVQMKPWVTKWSISRDFQIEIKFYSCLIKFKFFYRVVI